MSRKIVIYTRYSSEMQSPKSCEDQEREVRAGLARLGIDATNAVVIYDEAESGTKTFREQFERVEAMMRDGTLGKLVVDDQSRLSRADNVFAFITDLVYSGGRFISTGEGIDTIQQGWELRVKVMELHNSTTIRELARRVRRGQLGRQLSKLTSGDYPFGYESYFVHPEQVDPGRRGPKPEKNVRVKETAAKTIRQIFEWFLAGWSLKEIAAELTRRGTMRSNRSRKPQWTRQHVRRILCNTKYIGLWTWGTTTTMRNSSGKKKQVPVPKEQQVRMERPELRIVDQETWDRVQEKLRDIGAIYGGKAGQAKRGPKVHHTQAYPKSLLGGLLYCGECSARLHQRSSAPRPYMACPNAARDNGTCGMTVWTRIDLAEQALLDHVSALLKTQPVCLERAVGIMRQAIGEIAGRVPDEVAADEVRLHDVEIQAHNLVDALAMGTGESQVLRARLDELELEGAILRRRIGQAKELLAVPTELPDDDWINTQLRELPDLIRDDQRPAALLLRRLLGQVYVHQNLTPGKSRSIPQLRFKLDGWETLRVVLDGCLTDEAVSMIVPQQPTGLASEEYSLDIGELSRMDTWGPEIVEMRRRGVSWSEISKITGLSRGPAYAAWKRFVDVEMESVQPPDESDDLNSQSGQSDG